MPELPEVETVVRDLAPRVISKTIRDFQLCKKSKTILDKISLAKFQQNVKNKKISSVTRRAKYILINLNEGHISIHLRMTGRLMTVAPEKKDEAYIRAVFSLSDRQKLYFKDVRKFGKISYHKTLDDLEKKLGVEPLSKLFTVEHLSMLLSKSSKNIKAFLLDQSHICGLGNIYVDEALWESQIMPQRVTKSIKSSEQVLLHKSIKKVLIAGIKNNGITFDSFYFGDDKSGEYEKFLKVFGREGQKCLRCGEVIRKIKYAGRGTHFCIGCQK
jgi:formamidopyrimidine-DNA glycosylase